MKGQKEEHLREMQLACIGRLLASLSHEFKNHLAIIKESCGLVEDLLLLEDQEKPANTGRYKKIIDGINDRISQAAEMCRCLSGFSHRMDQPLSSFNPNDVLQEEIYLLQRLARQKQVDLALKGAVDLPVIFNNPSLLQFAVFCMLWPALESLEKHGRIVLATAQRGLSVAIVATFEGALQKTADENPWHALLPEVLHLLGAELARTVQPSGNEEFTLTLPSIEQRCP
jgi:phosphoglycerate-specific signal transduction histidine kinase